ncbi:hypothetical protein [Ancylobacter amanitiformis]|uniref:Uncharacterized protein n=1 Tax=Ancylobacter amanitiformis TaxID=217069 RepID=A0ABU0LQR7_9HYPH|nr:hypothetical protein [Ancylobacter amanitiformis]MDQ0510928.1 hypothetical protein [Ancylobacter amanitiformis]
MTSAPPRILALDIASQTGWAYGVPGEVPRAGTIRFASPGSSCGAVGRGMMRWFADFMKLCPVDALYFEAPFDPRKMGMRTNMNTSRILLGLVFLIETLAQAKGIGEIRETDISDVRKHFVGSNPPGEKGKLAVQQRCRHLGWRFDSEDAADSLAVWSYACAVVAPKTSIATTPLFQSRAVIVDKPQAMEKSEALLRRFNDIEDIPL